MVLAVVLLESEQISFVEKGGREEEVKKLPVSPSPPPPLSRNWLCSVLTPDTDGRVRRSPNDHTET